MQKRNSCNEVTNLLLTCISTYEYVPSSERSTVVLCGGSNVLCHGFLELTNCWKEKKWNFTSTHILISCLNTLRPRQNGRHFPDDISKCIFLNENMWIFIEISLKFVPKGLINNIPALVQIMARRRPGAEPLSEPMLVCLLTHICGTRPQWVKWSFYNWFDNMTPVDEIYSAAWLDDKAPG